MIEHGNTIGVDTPILMLVLNAVLIIIKPILEITITLQDADTLLHIGFILLSSWIALRSMRKNKRDQ